MDTVGNKAARSEIAQIKVVAPRMALRVLDRAIQAHGARRRLRRLPAGAAWAHARTLRLADGPDEVHLEAIAKIELQKSPRRSDASRPVIAAGLTDRGAFVDVRYAA